MWTAENIGQLIAQRWCLPGEQCKSLLQGNCGLIMSDSEVLGGSAVLYYHMQCSMQAQDLSTLARQSKIDNLLETNYIKSTLAISLDLLMCHLEFSMALAAYQTLHCRLSLHLLGSTGNLAYASRHIHFNVLRFSASTADIICASVFECYVF
jgi:hypothetical protein